MLARMLGGIVVGSILNTPAEDVWRVVSTLEGVNAELAPWIRMTSPPSYRGRSLEEAPVGALLFTSTLLFLGFVPFDRHQLALESVTRGQGFVERSSSWTERVWRHERHVRPSGPRACTVVDYIELSPRIRAAHGLLRTIVLRVFAHRHRRLRKTFGGEPLA